MTIDEYEGLCIGGPKDREIVKYKGGHKYVVPVLYGCDFEYRCSFMVVHDGEGGHERVLFYLPEDMTELQAITKLREAYCEKGEK